MITGWYDRGAARPRSAATRRLPDAKHSCLRPRVALVLSCCAATAWPQVAKRANEGYETAAGTQPRRRNLENPDREHKPKTSRTARRHRHRERETPSPISVQGSASCCPILSMPSGRKARLRRGHFSRLPRRKRSSKIRKHGWKNVKTVLGSRKGCETTARGRLISALILDVYHHFNYPVERVGEHPQVLQARRPPGGGRFLSQPAAPAHDARAAPRTHPARPRRLCGRDRIRRLPPQTPVRPPAPSIRADLQEEVTAGESPDDPQAARKP